MLGKQRVRKGEEGVKMNRKKRVYSARFSRIGKVNAKDVWKRVSVKEWRSWTFMGCSDTLFV